MSEYKKRRVLNNDYKSPTILKTVVPDGFKDKVNNHINSAYVGTVIRIYEPPYSVEGQLTTAHWVTEQGVHVTLHDEQRCDFITLKYKTWVVDHRPVKPGAMRLFTRPGTYDMKDETRKLTINKIKQKKQRILMNKKGNEFSNHTSFQKTQQNAIFLNGKMKLNIKHIKHTNVVFYAKE